MTAALANSDRKSPHSRLRVVRASLILGALLALDAVAGGHMVRADAGPDWSCAGSSAVEPSSRQHMHRPGRARAKGRSVARPARLRERRRAGLRIAGTSSNAGRVGSRLSTWTRPARSTRRATACGGSEQVGGDCAALSPALTVVLATLVDLAQSKRARSARAYRHRCRGRSRLRCAARAGSRR